MDFIRIYSRVLGLLAPEWTLAIILAAANVVLAGLQFVEPILFGRLVDLLTEASAHGPEQTWHRSLILTSFWAAVGLGGIGANILVALHADRLAHRRRLATAARYFEHVLALPFAFHGKTHSGQLFKIMLQGSNQLSGLWLAFFREHLSTLVAVLVLLPLTLVLNWRLALLLIALSAAFVILTAVAVSRTERAQASVEACHSEFAARADDAIGNVVLLQSFVRVALEVNELKGIMQRLLAAQFPVLNLWAIATVLSRAASTVTVILIFIFGTWLNVHAQASVGDIVSFMGFATLLIARLEQAIGFFSQMFLQIPGLVEFFAVLDTPSSVQEKPEAIELGRVRGEVAFEHVTLSYDGVRSAVADLSFSVPAGSTVALVGPTGAGKTTIMALLCRFWDPQSGSIRLDGVDIRDVTLASLRSNIGVVFQDTPLLYRSVADNLRVGRLEASDEEIITAGRLAEAHDFIMAQPNGYAALVGERGRLLSGGERQRLAIARALLKDPPILVLDEATSALDAVTEARIQQALKRLMRGRTTFVIAHRLSTIREVQLILVLDKGRIAESGSYAELIARNGVFAKLVATQLETRPVEAAAACELTASA